MRKLTVALICLLMPVFSCDDVLDKDKMGKSVSSLVVGDGPQADFVGRSGKRYKWLRKVPLSTAPASNGEWIDRAPKSTTTLAVPNTRESLREGMRTHLFTPNGHEFISDEPDDKVVDIIMQAQAGKIKIGRDANRFPTKEDSSEFGVTKQPYLWANNRHFAGCDRTNYPQAQAVWVNGDSGGCSATLVGPHTVLSAAHCFYYNGNTSQLTPVGWRAKDWLTPGKNSTTDCGQSGEPFGKWGDWSVAMPGYWMNGDGNWDFAVLEVFPNETGYSPGQLLGWLGLETGTEFMFAQHQGFPGDKEPYPQLWVSTGYIGANYNSMLVAGHTDMTGGDSGGGMHNDYYNVMGTASRVYQYCFFTCSYYNLYQAWNNNFYAFAVQNGL